MEFIEGRELLVVFRTFATVLVVTEMLRLFDMEDFQRSLLQSICTSLLL